MDTNLLDKKKYIWLNPIGLLQKIYLIMGYNNPPCL